MYSARRGRARGKSINLLLLHYRVRKFKKGKDMEYENFGKEDNLQYSSKLYYID